MCIYCGCVDADSVDHLPSKGLFPDPGPIPLVEVPSCQKCNQGFSKDEEFFRNFVCNFGIEANAPSAHLLAKTKVARSAKRRPALMASMFKKMSLVDFCTPGGIYLGKKTLIQIPSEDHERVRYVMQKYIKGLYFNEFKKIIPPEYEVTIFLWASMREIREIVPGIRYNKSFADVFKYGYGRDPESDSSIWLFVFFNKFPVLTFVTTSIFKEYRAARAISQPEDNA